MKTPMPLTFVQTLGTGPEDATLADVVNLGRNLSGATIQTSEQDMLNWLKWYWKSEGYEARSPFTDAGFPLIVVVLKGRIDGLNVAIHRVKRPDGSITSFAVSMNHTSRGSKQHLTGEEIEGLNAYLRLQIRGIGEAPPFWPITPAGNWARLIQHEFVGNFAIDSDEFRASELFLIPAEVIDGLAETAEISIVDARRLPLKSLILKAAKQVCGEPAGRVLCNDETNDPAHRTAHVTSNTGAPIPKTTISHRKKRSFDGQCKTLLRRWVAAMEKKSEWIPRETFFNNELPVLQGKSPNTWDPSWKPRRFNDKFKDNPTEWQEQVSQWAPSE